MGAAITSGCKALDTVPAWKMSADDTCKAGHPPLRDPRKSPVPPWPPGPPSWLTLLGIFSTAFSETSSFPAAESPSLKNQNMADPPFQDSVGKTCTRDSSWKLRHLQETSGNDFPPWRENKLHAGIISLPSPASSVSSQLGAILETFGNVWRHFWLLQSGGGNRKWESLLGSSEYRSEILLNILQSTGRLIDKYYPAPNGHSAEVKKAYSSCSGVKV